MNPTTNGHFLDKSPFSFIVVRLCRNERVHQILLKTVWICTFLDTPKMLHNKYVQTNYFRAYFTFWGTLGKGKNTLNQPE